MSIREHDEMRSTLFVLVAALVIARAAAAEELTLADGSRWTRDGHKLQRGAITAWATAHEVGVDCAGGLVDRPKVTRSYLPPGFIATEEPERGGIRLTACVDAPGVAGEIVVRRPLTLSPQDERAIGALISELGAAFSGQSFGEPQELLLMQPEIARVRLTAATGEWNFFISETTAHETMLAMQWPLGTGVLKLTRSPATQRCSTTGLSATGRPGWAPASFSRYRAVRGELEFACLDSADGHVLIVGAPTTRTSSVTQRTRALLEAIVAVIGAAPAEVTAPTYASSSSSSFPSSSSYVSPVDTRSSDRYASRSFMDRLRGLSLTAHQLSAEGDMIEDSYGASLSYARGSGQGRKFRPRVVLGLGYDQRSKLLVDGRLELGARAGDDGAGIGAFFALGADAIGLGEEEAADRVHMPLDAYYGGGLRLWLAELEIEVAHVWRNADAIDGEWRLELGYRLRSGRRIAGRYVSYADAASLLGLSLRF